MASKHGCGRERTSGNRRSFFRLTALPFVGLATAVVLVSSCAGNVQETALGSSIVVLDHSPTRVVQVLDTNNPAARNAAKVVVGALLAGDAYIAVDSKTGNVLVSVVVPGPRLEPEEVTGCTKKRVGGVGPRCKTLIHELLALNRFRLSVSSLVDNIPGSETDDTVAASCTMSSGWPHAVIHRLVVGMSEADQSLTNVLVVSGDGDVSDGRQPRISAELLASLRVVIAPASLACGDHARAWFAGALSVRLFTSEQPLTTLPSIIFDPPRHEAEVAR